MEPLMDDEALYPTTHPLKIFDLARSQNRFVHVCAPMVRYSKLAFRQTAHHYGTDICYTPMILAKEFNRSAVARSSDLTMSTSCGSSSGGCSEQQQQPCTVAQFGANSPRELARAASLAAPFVNGVDLNCGCPQSWACAQTLGAALMEQRELVRDMVVETRSRLRSDGWAVDGFERDMDNPKGRSVSVKIRVHKDLRKTMDWIETVLGDGERSRNVDWLTIHPRTRSTPSSHAINLDALSLLTDKFGDRVPILVSGDVFTLSTLPYESHLLKSEAYSYCITKHGGNDKDHSNNTNGTSDITTPAHEKGKPIIPKLRGLMSARALLANPALFAGHETCPWEAVDIFMSHVARAPLPLRLGIHHLYEMCGPGYGPDKRSLLSKRERVRLVEMDSWVDVVDYMDEMSLEKRGCEIVRMGA